MRHGKRLIIGAAVIAAIALGFIGHSIERYPAVYPDDRSGDGLAVYGESRQAGRIDGGTEESGQIGTVGENGPAAYTYSLWDIELDNQGQKIYGVAYIPNTESEKVPLVICAHGLGGSYQTNAAYAEWLASHGIAAYCFDFRGGGGTRSDGDTTEMSVMTEVSDLETVMEAAPEWEFADGDKIVLLGTSQGGCVSAIAAARHADRVSGLVLMYPAFLGRDAVHERFDSLEEVPDEFPFMWITAGRRYVEDLWDYDVYEEIGNYTGKVLLMHGSADSIVPFAYSDRAAEVYEDVEYHVIDGAGHGFHGSAFDEAVGYIFAYLQEIQII